MSKKIKTKNRIATVKENRYRMTELYAKLRDGINIHQNAVGLELDDRVPFFNPKYVDQEIRAMLTEIGELVAESLKEIKEIDKELGL